MLFHHTIISILVIPSEIFIYLILGFGCKLSQPLVLLLVLQILYLDQILGLLPSSSPSFPHFLLGEQGSVCRVRHNYFSVILEDVRPEMFYCLINHAQACLSTVG
jgi:hypothetical protein